ncbi:MAG: hypothetical protein NTZ80_02430 [Patescibacteria group bacterium]|nr:hypothetical protein [Patescibacteria group bacterium]
MARTSQIIVCVKNAVKVNVGIFYTSEIFIKPYVKYRSLPATWRMKTGGALLMGLKSQAK